MRKPPKVALIGGTDSSGSSGLDADFETARRLGCHPLGVITAITSQPQDLPIHILSLPAEALNRQLNDLLDQNLQSVKIGMLPDEESVETVIGFLQHCSCKKVILDPVMKTSSGQTLISPKGLLAMKDRMLHLVSLLTPNLEEARILAGAENGVATDRNWLADQCLLLGSQAVLIKGGHGDESDSIDLLVERERERVFLRWPRIQGGTQVRGTGCRLASAIACHWSEQTTLDSAVKRAGQYLQQYLLNSRK